MYVKPLSPPELHPYEVCPLEEIHRNSKYMGKVVADTRRITGTQESTKCMPEYAGLVSALFTAYSRHFGICLTPDVVWMAIMAQVSFYVNARAEELRSRLVTHEGRKDIEISMTGSVHTCDYGEFVLKVLSALGDDLKTDLVQQLRPDFSTTDKNSLVAFGISLMSTLQKYYTFICNLRCGLPFVKLLGKVGDWEKICDKVRTLRLLATDDGAMVAWLKMLEPVVAQMLQTARGVDNMRWWQGVVHETGGGSGPSYNEGWSAVFSAFTSKGMLRKPGPTGYPRIDTNNFAPGVVCAPVRILAECTYNATIISGICASRVNSTPDGLSMTPLVSWSINIPESQFAPAAHAPAAHAPAAADEELNYRGP